ncbi:histidine--tRNA ligase [Leptolyngbya sp. FACHB-261]|uniref:histidine--tRNA ligase n=1 Tax=Leptolyngbya sp. FACHB-261 TaxID=2692806 RepID=UPI00168466E1|nr:histidine--tRNA ligase [Leptolyngbya sp. FACHB-261]MBD2103861.1 histidine--tRNA ligase [Leptolyngbya sp. FACHB-261]
MGSIQASRGTRDILADEIAYWQRLEAVARTLLPQAAYQEIRTPLFEQTDLFERGIGEATDVVGKEMYTFEDRGGRSLTLRPEGTAGVVRAYIEHGLQAQGGVQRLWYLGPMFRYERPQAGRQRQFHQLGIEVIGSRDPRADVEVIALFNDFLTQLGITDLSLELNSVGNPEDRQRYRAALVDYFTPYQQELDADSQDRLSRNPLRILDSKDPRTQAIAVAAPSILDYLGPDSKVHFDQVQALLSDLDIGYRLNPRLVRGLDYYTHTAFEFQSGALGAQSAVGGGGRYDGLVSELGGPATPAVGWAIGLERLVLLLQRLQPLSATEIDVYIISKGSLAEANALKLARQLRQQGLGVELDLSSSAFSKQFKRADRSGASVALVLGDEETQAGTVQIKWLKSGEQRTLAQTQLLTEAQSLFRTSSEA